MVGRFGSNVPSEVALWSALCLMDQLLSIPVIGSLMDLGMPIEASVQLTQCVKAF